MSIKNKITAGLVLLLAGHSAFAENASSGLMYGNKSDSYWFKTGGTVKLDHRIYFGKTKNNLTPNIGGSNAGNYYTGTALRETSLKFEGGLGANYQFAVNLSFNPITSGVNVEEAALTYNGFRELLPNLSFSVGQVNPGFCLESSSSSKWTPFMEKSLGAVVFGPHPATGVSASTFNKAYSLTIAATNPKPNIKVLDVNGNALVANDRGLYSARGTYSPINSDGELLQLGVSSHYNARNNTGINFAIDAETKSRNSFSIFNTTGYLTNPVTGAVTSGPLIIAKNQMSYDIELMAQHGPLYAEAEYQIAKIKRGTVNQVLQGSDLTFYGYHAQVAYVLTGEVRKRSDATATLGQITPEHNYGAVEAAVRYSHLNLNSQDIQGGLANNVTVSLSWYTNQNVRFITEYTNSIQKRTLIGLVNNPTLKMNVESIGARVQFIF